jgi:hypothetical protein
VLLAFLRILRQLTRQRAVKPAGVARGRVEDGQVQLVVAHHVHELRSPNDPACRSHVRVASRRRRRVEVEHPKLAQLEWRQILGSRFAFLHGPVFYRARAGTRAG